jgi:hypothetical protein
VIAFVTQGFRNDRGDGAIVLDQQDRKAHAPAPSATGRLMRK